jgi:D-alanyl-lipoteichoic acid acyltransferase DltB (MBOAT superfamily)
LPASRRRKGTELDPRAEPSNAPIACPVDPPAAPTRHARPALPARTTLMLFIELRFFFFFAVVFAVHWALRRAGARKLWLLACSYVFYGAWDWRFLGLIFASTLIDYVAALFLARPRPPGGRRFWLAFSVTVNLGVLGLFKYYDFFAEQALALGQLLGWRLSPLTLHLTLPVGISFYTFQSLSYTIDVYRKELAATRSFTDFALFVAFFPQLVAGPIVRAADFLPQLRVPRRLAQIEFRPLLTLFLVGYVKKACIADNLASLVDPVFAGPGNAGAATLWLAAFLYGVQIFCDFSGYSDMAIATGGLLGYRLPENFRAPYLASTVSQFWRRWHISLSTWFRDYVYIPVGGGRRSPPRVYANLIIVFLLCGLWHGARWNFVLWGLIHGLFLVLERPTRLAKRESWSLLGNAYVLLVVMPAWVVFRTPDLATAALYCRSALTLRPLAGAGPAIDPSWWALLPVLWIVQVFLARRGLEERVAAMPDALFAAAYGAAFALVLPFAAANYLPFVYFQF